ncbi:type IV pilin [Candidatus Pacearchaeota archaeon]|nr:type IV pilin [Candidatus Pacearchaeota archaeon]
MKKRGLSTIVATVLIIMITVVSAAVIATFVVPFVRDGLQKSTECVDYDSYFMFDESLRYNCYAGTGYNISVRAANLQSASEKVKGFNLVLYAEGYSIAVPVLAGEPVNAMRMFDITAPALAVPRAGETRTYYYDDGAVYTSGELYPILASGKVCKQRNDRIAFVRCSGRRS